MQLQAPRGQDESLEHEAGWFLRDLRLSRSSNRGSLERKCSPRRPCASRFLLRKTRAQAELEASERLKAGGVFLTLASLTLRLECVFLAFSMAFIAFSSPGEAEEEVSHARREEHARHLSRSTQKTPLRLCFLGELYFELDEAKMRRPKERLERHKAPVQLAPLRFEGLQGPQGLCVEPWRGSGAAASARRRRSGAPGSWRSASRRRQTVRGVSFQKQVSIGLERGLGLLKI